MGKIKKIPKHNEIKKQREEEQAEREERAREQLIKTLQDKTLKAMFHLYLGLEELEYLKVTTDYNKKLKRDGERFFKELEKTVVPKIDSLYANNPEFTTNMFREMDEAAAKWSKLLFADYPCANKMMDEFIKDPEYWRENLVMQFNKLDAE